MQLVAFPTIHAKHELLADLFAERLGWQFLVPDLDTDTFGTFASEVPRKGTPRETVIAKAKAGAVAAGVSVAIASEGTIGFNPALPFATTDTELIAYVDLERDLEFVQSHVSANIVAVSEIWQKDFDVESLARKADLPTHGLIVRTQKQAEILARKDIHSVDRLRDCIHALAQVAGRGEVVIESDFRANHSPTRQANILTCAEKLVTRLESRCPSCDAQGWGVVGTLTGLPCELCGHEVQRAVRAEILGCLSCDYTLEAAVGMMSAKASSCDYCNP